METFQLRQKPEVAVAKVARNSQRCRAMSLLEMLTLRLEDVQRGDDRPHIALPLDRKPYRPAGPVKQLCAEIVLRLPDEVADGGLRHIHLLRRAGKASEPSRRLDGEQWFQRRDMSPVPHYEVGSYLH